MNAQSDPPGGELFTRAEIDDLRRLVPWQSAFQVLHCWGSILLVWAICVIWPNPLTITLGVLIVGTRQLGLGILNHEAAHHLLFPSRALSDWVAEWVLSRPLLGAGIASYRKVHLQHHRFTQQPSDPDLNLSAPFPITRSSFWRKVWRDLSGQTAIKQHAALLRSILRQPAPGNTSEANAKAMANAVTTAELDANSAGRRRMSARAQLIALVQRLGPNLLINLVLFGGFVALGKGYLYLLLWVLPELTWRPLITRIRNIGEHAVVPDNSDRLRNTRTTLANRLERLLLAPYFVNYHLEHHLLASVPCYKLPMVHRLLIRKGLLPRMEVQPGYLAMLRLACSRVPHSAT